MQIKFNDVVAKFNKYGHFKLGEDYMPTASNELSNEEDRDFAYDAVEKDTTYKIHGELDDEDINYSYIDYEDLSASEYKWYELKAKIDALRISNEKQEKSGYGKYNLRNGKNLIANVI